MRKRSQESLLPTCVLVGEYLSEKQGRPTFYVRKIIEWENTLKNWLYKDLKHFKR